jgi:hypothetical protein
VTITTEETDEEATGKIRNIMRTLAEGRYGKKVLLKIESKDQKYPTHVKFGRELVKQQDGSLLGPYT